MPKHEHIHDEFDLIQKVIHSFETYQQQNTLVPNGDDAAIFKPNGGMGQIICVDTLVEGIHFKRETMSPFQIGYKSLAVNLSDIAAMGGNPTYFLVSLAIPPTWSMDEMVELYQGMKSLADQWKIDLLGGDTVSTQQSLVVTVTAVGQVEEGIRLLRSQAKPTDVLFVTGELGNSAAGLHYLLSKKQKDSEALSSYISKSIQAHQLPPPHIVEGRILAEAAKSLRIALNDVSDGLASEANEIAQSSRVNIVIEKEKLPVSPGLFDYAKGVQVNPYEWILNGGEDFVLVGTIPASQVNFVQKRMAEEKCSFHIIGYVEAGDGQVFIKENEQLFPLQKSGFNHFARPKE